MSDVAWLLDGMSERRADEVAPVPHVATVTAVTGSVLTLDYGNGVTGTAALSQVKAIAGDRVEVQVIGRQMVVTANYTHPVTDDSKAQDALDLAGLADQAATQAQESADSASESSRKALSYLLEVEDDWEAIEGYREDAEVTLVDIHTAATDAADAASAAQDAADAAQESADDAKDAADRSLVQLSIVEDVAGTLTWISEHGTYEATSDTTVQDGTVYFEKVGNDYVPIASPDPTKNPSTEGWYVLVVTDSQTEYIMAHLAVTSQGLWVLPSGIGSETTPDTGETQADSDARQGDGYKVLLSNSGMTVYDGTGDAVATYGGTGIRFADDRSFYIGDEDAYIFFDGNGHITIGGAVTLGSTKTLSELLGEVEQASEDAATALDAGWLAITSTNGNLFKNGAESTVLQVAVFPNGGGRLDTIADVQARFGPSAYIEWRWKHEDSGTWGTIVSSDPHLSMGGMWLTVTPSDVATKTTFEASLVVPDAS